MELGCVGQPGLSFLTQRMLHCAGPPQGPLGYVGFFKQQWQLRRSPLGVSPQHRDRQRQLPGG